MASERGEPINPIVPGAQEPVEVKDSPAAADSAEAQQGGKKKCKCKKVKPTKGCIIRIFIGLILLGFIIYLIVDFNRVRQGFVDFIQWFENNLVLGLFLLLVIYLFATVLFVPGLLLTIGAGAAIERALNSVWQAILLGSVVVWIGASIGAFVAMLLGRYLLRSTIQRKALKYRIFRAIDTALKKDGFKFTVLLRLCPLIPFAFLNYAFGLTSVSIKNYLLGGIGMIPGTVAYVYLGTTISSIADASSGGFDGGPVELGLIIGGSVLAVVAVVLVTIRAKKELNKLIKAEKEAEERKKKQEEERQQKEGGEGGNQENGDQVIDMTEGAAQGANNGASSPGHNKEDSTVKLVLNQVSNQA